MKIGDRIFVRGYIDEIRKDTVIVRNDGGYFGTIPSEVITGELPSAQPETHEERTETHACDLISRQATIDVEGLDEQIRCEMCRNPMHTNRGCDGNCKYDEKLYERIMQILGERIKPSPSAEPRKKGKWIYGEKSGQDGWYCSECGGFIPWDYVFYGLDNIDFIEEFKTCPFCDSKMVSYTGADMREGEEDG